MAKIEGLRELSKQLDKLGKELGTKTLRNASRAAMSPTHKKIKALTPVGKRAHRTYKGRLVAPGFLKRSIKLGSRAKRGVVTASISAKPEAFYGMFLVIGTEKIPARDFFFRVFANDRAGIESRLVSQLKKRIDKI